MQVLALDTAVGSLLIPTGMVAQIVSRSELKSNDIDLPFVHGSIEWRDRQIPLVMSSKMLGMKSNEDENYAQAVILWPLSGSAKTDLFALTSFQPPHIMTLSENLSAGEYASKLDIRADDFERYSLGLVELENGIGIIPNLKALSSDLFLT